LDWKDELTAEQRARWNDPSREPFYLFKSIEEELTTSPEFWHTRTSGERMEYLEHTRWVIFGKEAMSTPFVRCYGRRKLGEEPDLKSVVYF
jgi:hypothetical protein